MPQISLWNIFSVFLRIGAFTIGGGYAMIPAIQAEMLRRGWMTEEELPDIIALAQGAPGLLAVNMSIFAGYKLRGLKGGIAATLGCIVAPFIIILLIAMVFTSFKDNLTVQRMFMGIRPVTIALIASPLIKMARRNRTVWAWAITAGVFAAITFLKFSPVYILLVILVIAVAAAWYKEGRSGR